MTKTEADYIYGNPNSYSGTENLLYLILKELEAANICSGCTEAPSAEIFINSIDYSNPKSKIKLKINNVNPFNKLGCVMLEVKDNFGNYSFLEDIFISFTQPFKDIDAFFNVASELFIGKTYRIKGTDLNGKTVYSIFK